MSNFDRIISRILGEAEEPLDDHTGEEGVEGHDGRSANDLEAILLRWKDRNVTSIKGPLLQRFLSFLEKTKERLPIPIQGALFPRTPDDKFSKVDGWIPSGDED